MDYLNIQFRALRFEILIHFKLHVIYELLGQFFTSSLQLLKVIL